MAIDYAGGLDAGFEYPFAACPAPGMRDAINMWVSDDRGALGLPRFAVEAAAPGIAGASEDYAGRESAWTTHDMQLNCAFPDGRVYRLRATGPKWPVAGADGVPRVLGGGPLGFECVEPFRRWTARFDGEATATTTAALAAGDDAGPAVPIPFALETEMAAPPWSVGSLGDAAGLKASEDYMGAVGGARIEQLFRTTGTLSVAGETHRFSGSGLRIRRKGIRTIGGFWGHCWQSALFPSARGFGLNTYPPAPDGRPALNEGYLFLGDGALIPARVVDAPWLKDLQGIGEDVGVTLETPLGRTRIEGEVVLATYDAKVRAYGGMEFPVLSQSGVRYRWDGEETFGMMERSSLRARMTL